MQVVSLREKVAERLVSSNETVRENIITKFVAEEIAKRTQSVEHIINKLDQLNKDQKKFKATQLYDASGQVVSETYTKSDIDAMKKNKEQIAKLDGALELALSKGDFTKVLELGKSDSSNKSSDSDQ